MSDTLFGSTTDAGCALGIGLFQIRQTMLQAQRVERADGENADATLRASGAAHEPMAATTGGVGEGGVDELNKLLVA